MAIRLTPLQSLIESLFTEVDSLNIKQPRLNLEADQPPVDPTAPPAPNPVPDPAGTPAAPAGADPTGGATGVDPALGGLPGDPGAMGAGGTPGAPGGDPNDPNAPEGEDPMGGGGSGFGGFGGGGGGGGGGDDPAAPAGGDAEGDAAGPEEPQGDPIKAMVDGAQELLNQTQDPNLILKSLKGQIQTLFSEPEHALGLVKALYDTNDSLLQSVAMRLWVFLKAESPKR